MKTFMISFNLFLCCVLISAQDKIALIDSTFLEGKVIQPEDIKKLEQEIMLGSNKDYSDVELSYLLIYHSRKGKFAIISMAGSIYGAVLHWRWGSNLESATYGDDEAAWSQADRISQYSHMQHLSTAVILTGIIGSLLIKNPSKKYDINYDSDDIKLSPLGSTTWSVGVICSPSIYWPAWFNLDKAETIEDLELYVKRSKQGFATCVNSAVCYLTYSIVSLVKASKYSSPERRFFYGFQLTPTIDPITGTSLLSLTKTF